MGSGERASQRDAAGQQQLVLSPSTRASHRTSCTVDSLGCFCTAPSPRSRHRRRSRLRPRRRLILISPCRVNPPERSGTSLVAFCDSSRHPADVSLCPQQASRPRRVLRRASCAPSLAPPLDVPRTGTLTPPCARTARTTDAPELHQGRKRAVPHQRGLWAAHVFLERASPLSSPAFPSQSVADSSRSRAEHRPQQDPQEGDQRRSRCSARRLDRPLAPLAPRRRQQVDGPLVDPRPSRPLKQHSATSFLVSAAHAADESARRAAYGCRQSGCCLVRVRPPLSFTSSRRDVQLS